MKKAIVYLAFMTSLSSCSQKKENLKEQNMEITSGNIASKTIEQIKHYPSEPIYYYTLLILVCL